MAITPSESVKLSANWGVSFSDYSIDGVPVDFQDMMVAVSEKRATTVENEVPPLTTRIKDRNTALDKLGEALSDFTKIQANFASDAQGSATAGNVSSDTVKTVSKYLRKTVSNPPTKANVEYYIQLIKSKMDGLNNESQTDMTRLQSLVDRRDEAYSTATDLMTSISDTRSNLIRNL